MKIKLCYDNEIHKLSSAPTNLASLLEAAGSIFQVELPRSWALQYVDSDGDNIMITDEKDYEEFKLSEQGSDAIVKLFVIAREGLKKDDDVVIVENDTNDAKEEEDEYQVIQREEDISKPVVREHKEEPVEEKKESESVESARTEKNKVCLDVKVLEKLVAAMIDKSLPKISEYTQQEIDKQKGSIMLSNNDSMLSQEEEQQSRAEKAVHSGVRCDGCEIMPIVGVRYKCQSCPCFNYCERCEENNEHTHHNFVKMKKEDIWDSLFPPLSSVRYSNKESNKAFEGKETNIFSLLNAESVMLSEEKNGNQEENAIEATEAVYYDNLMEKVRKLLKCFPQAKFDMLCVYVNEAPEDMTLEELVENYKH